MLKVRKFTVSCFIQYIIYVCMFVPLFVLDFYDQVHNDVISSLSATLLLLSWKRLSEAVYQ